MESQLATMNAQGRIVIPVRIRRAVGIEAPADLLLRIEDGSIIVETVEAAVAGAQDVVARYAEQDRSLVDELIAERRAEAAAE